MSGCIFDCIGHTPLVEIPAFITMCKAKVFVKLEEFNLGGSIKSRIGYQMIVDSEEDGLISKDNPDDVTIIEPTGGNTGIGLAQVCAYRGYHCILVIPDNYSKIRIRVLEDMGATVILSESRLGNDSHIKKARELLLDNPNFIMLDQFTNPSNPKAHYLWTGTEILRECPFRINYFVAGVGSGGTISGAGQAIKEKYSDCKVVAVQPYGCDIINGIFVPHKIQGIAIGMIPSTFNKSIVDEVFSVKENEMDQCREALAQKVGLYLGYSAAANVYAAINIARNASPTDIVVTIAPDGGRNYS